MQNIQNQTTTAQQAQAHENANASTNGRYIAALIINHDIPELDALRSAYQPLGIYPSRTAAVEAARRASPEYNADGYTVFPETSDTPLHRRIIEQIRNKRETKHLTPCPVCGGYFCEHPENAATTQAVMMMAEQALLDNGFQLLTPETRPLN